MLGLNAGVVLLAAAATGADPAQEALPCPNSRTQWAGTIGPTASASDIAVDSAGNVLVAGHFAGTVDLDPTEGVDERTSKGWDTDAYLLKVMADGSYGWAYTIGAEDVGEYATALVATPDGRIIVAGSSDSPVVPANPWAGIYAAVSRMAETGEAILPQERITLSDTLKLYTINAAAMSFEEDIKGSLVNALYPMGTEHPVIILSFVLISIDRAPSRVSVEYSTRSTWGLMGGYGSVSIILVALCQSPNAPSILIPSGSSLT